MTNLLIDVSLQSGKDLKIYVPEPLKEEIKAISRILGYFYKVISEQREAAVVIITDWERLVDESLEGLDSLLEGRARKNLDSFFNRCIDKCSIIDNDVVFDYTTEERQKYLNDEDILDRFKGTLLFISALLRYLEKGQREDILTDFSTSLTILDLQKSLKKSAKEASPENQKGQKVSLKIS